jgi:hypothetical protein
MSKANSLNIVNRKFNDLAPCGVFCGACPSYEKSCRGCASEDTKQKRKSKWGCKIRNCCYEIKKLDFCIECDQFPCNIFNTKLLSTHFNDPKFTYRFEIPLISKNLKMIGIDKFHEFQLERWKCECGGTILFYDYKCIKCNNEKLIT